MWPWRSITCPGGKPLAGLERRRAAEQALFNTPVEAEEIVTYKYLKDVPEKVQSTIEQLMDAGIIQGDGSDSTGNGDVINLTHEQIWTQVFVYRGGGFNTRLRVAGLLSAVQ